AAGHPWPEGRTIPLPPDEAWHLPARRRESGDAMDQLQAPGEPGLKSGYPCPHWGRHLTGPAGRGRLDASYSGKVAVVDGHEGVLIFVQRCTDLLQLGRQSRWHSRSLCTDSGWSAQPADGGEKHNPHSSRPAELAKVPVNGHHNLPCYRP